MFSLTVNIVSEFFDRHFFGELPHRCIETDLSDGLDLSLENEICALNAACVFLISQEWYYY